MSHDRTIARRTVLSAAAGVGATSAIGAAQARRGTGPGRSSGNIELELIGRYSTGQFDADAAEIPAYDPATERVFVVNAEAGAVDVLDVSDPAAPAKDATLRTSEAFDDAGATNSVDVHDGVAAVAVAAAVEQEPGRILFYDTETFEPIGSVEVGPLPDYVTFSPDGRYVVSADEGEPDDEYETDPASRISVVDVADGVSDATVRVAGFERFDEQREELVESGVRLFGPGSSVAEDLEPEGVAVGRDSTTAWITLQENNALAIVDLETATVTEIVPLGYKDHSVPGNGLDAVDDGEIAVRPESVFGMYQPDDVDTFTSRGETYVVTSAEGDAREYEGLTEATDIDGAEGEVVTVGTLREADRLADPDAVPERLDELEVTAYPPYVDGQPETYEELYAFGGRSFAIWDADGELVFESGNEFERRIARHYPDQFNADNDENGLDEESAASGPEPEGVAVGRVGGAQYAFIGVEEMGGVMVYEVTDPRDPTFVQYVDTRNFAVDPEDDIDEGDAPADAAGDLGPEGLEFVPAAESPIDDPLLVVGFEVSGTTGIYRIATQPPTAPRGGLWQWLWLLGGGWSR